MHHSLPKEVDCTLRCHTINKSSIERGFSNYSELEYILNKPEYPGEYYDMKNRLHVGFVVLTFIPLFLAAMASCTKPPADTGQTDQGSTQGNTSASTSENGTGSSEETNGAQVRRPDAVSVEDLQSITAYGVFMFPDSELDTDRSRHQSTQNGQEQYILLFTSTTSIDAVADWYSDNLEPECGKVETQLAPGKDAVQFRYTPEDERILKSIFIQGTRGQEGCEITVSLQRGPDEDGDSVGQTSENDQG
jgi:hypothetical protein